MRHRARSWGVLLLLAAPLWAGTSEQPAPSTAAPAAAVEDRGAAAPESTLVAVLAAPDSLDLPLRETKYFYSSFGAPDPFRALVGGEFEPYDGLVDLHAARLVGVLWRGAEYVAIVQDMQGFGYNLRPGDPVRNGSVVSVTRYELVGHLTLYGQTDRVTLRLEREE